MVAYGIYRILYTPCTVQNVTSVLPKKKIPIGIRPIVLSVNSVTKNISSFVDFWLQPLVKQLPSYLRHERI